MQIQIKQGSGLPPHHHFGEGGFFRLRIEARVLRFGWIGIGHIIGAGAGFPPSCHRSDST